jgi:hypothetical protein
LPSSPPDPNDITVTVHDKDCAVSRAIRADSPGLESVACTCRALTVPGVWSFTADVRDGPHPQEELRTVAARLLADLPGLAMLGELLADEGDRRKVRELTEALTVLAGNVAWAVETLDRQRQQLTDYQLRLVEANHLHHWLAQRVGLPWPTRPIRILEQLSRVTFVAMHVGDRPFALNGVAILYGDDYRYACPRDGCDWATGHALFGTILQRVHHHDRIEHP